MTIKKYLFQLFVTEIKIFSFFIFDEILFICIIRVDLFT